MPIVHTMLFLSPRARSDVEIDADNGLQAVRFAFLVEIYRTVQVAVVGQRERFLPVGLCGRDKFGNFRQCFKKGVMAMRVEMNEVLRTHAGSISPSIFPHFDFVRAKY